MIYLELFITFFKIGLFSFGGGYGMLPLIIQETISRGWITESALYEFVGVAESTPGPLAINMATFIGSTVTGGNFLGSVCATLGAVLPSFIIILLIAIALKSLFNSKTVKNALAGIKAVIVGLIASTGVTLLLNNLCGGITISGMGSAFDWRALAITAVLFTLAFTYKGIKKKNFPAILLIVISAAVGIVVYSL